MNLPTVTLFVWSGDGFSLTSFSCCLWHATHKWCDTPEARSGDQGAHHQRSQDGALSLLKEDWVFRHGRAWFLWNDLQHWCLSEGKGAKGEVADASFRMTEMEGRSDKEKFPWRGNLSEALRLSSSGCFGALSPTLYFCSIFQYNINNQTLL